MRINKYHLKFTQALILSAIVLLLQACSMGGQLLKETESFKDVTKDEIIVVGTIHLTPKLEKDEQELNPSGVIDLGGYGDMNRNRSMIQFNDKPQANNYKSMINPELGKTFFFTIPRNMEYMVEGSVLLEFSRYGNTGKIHLPTWFKIDIKPGDKAIYIGDLKYKRDDFNSIIDVKLVDNYKKARNQFRKKFGKKYKLRKSLIRNIKS